MASTSARDVHQRVAGACNCLAGSITAQIRLIESFAPWQSNRSLRCLHGNLEQARSALLAAEPKRTKRQLESADDDAAASWLEILGLR